MVVWESGLFPCKALLLDENLNDQSCKLFSEIEFQQITSRVCWCYAADAEPAFSLDQLHLCFEVK